MSTSILEELTELERQFDSQDAELEFVARDEEVDVEGWVVVWNTQASIGGPLEGIGKGGTRVTPNVSLDEVRMLARLMTLKNAAAGLPLGGSKSGLRADSSSPNFEKVYRRFVRLCEPVLRPNGPFGGFGFDVGCRPEQPIWACDELERTDCCTGKPLNMGGTDYDREGIAGYGVAIAAQSLLTLNNLQPENASIAIQGLGAMGSAVFRFAHEYGAHARFISDPRIGGTWELPNQLSPELITALSTSDVQTAASLLTNEAVGPHSLGAVLFSEVDVLFPCALKNAITSDNANDIKARYIVEGANHPTHENAYKQLQELGIAVVPDVIANPGGIIAAFVEMTSTVTPEENVAYRVNPEKAKQLTQEKISENVATLMQLIHEGLEPHAAGKLMALRNIFK